MSLYKNNFDLLNKYNSTLSGRIADFPDDKKIELVKAKSGGYSLNISNRFIHSIYDPYAQAEDFIKQFVLSEDDCLFILGLGLGYHLLEIAKSKKVFRRIFIVEPDINVFKAALKVNDFSKFIKNKKVVWLIGAKPYDVQKAVTNNTIAVVSSKIKIIEYCPRVMLDQEYFEAVKEKIKDGMKTSSAIVDTMEFAKDNFIENTAMNLADFVLSPGVNTLANKFKKIPAIIVSAGPSLDKNIDQLHKAKGKCLILATDTALKILLKHGIKPDFVFTVDYKEISRLHFDNLNVSDVPLVFDPEAACASLEAYKGPRFVSATEKPFTYWLNSVCAGKGFIAKGMSVAHYVFSVACAFGCEPIIFIGQDLSYPGGFSHARGTSSRVKVQDEASKKNLVKIKSIISDEELTTNKEMYIYLRHFEILVGNSNRLCVNATEGGAGIKGTKNMALEKAIKKYCVKKIDTKKIISLAQAQKKPISVQKSMMKIKQMIFELDKFIAASEAIGVILKQLFVFSKAEKIDKKKISYLLSRLKDPAGFIRKSENILKIMHADLLKEMIQLEKEKRIKVSSIKKTDFSQLAIDFKDDLIFQIKINKGAKFLRNCLSTGLSKLEKISHINN